ncbi:hypothetical protein M378DRAFT_69747 [Amanita muscaria Koide BX008]|uniref:Dihydroorotate dehydrogenase (quinone), mitochondrial n=1 Tax=Amanita muscaria (strain Koide BX008) TaxID=946122 RepID=A0A0C2TQD5_AMAMK|nr:hypothetical protein M378DRAFT_69747 [Amanita muscaria Koide BX008]
MSFAHRVAAKRLAFLRPSRTLFTSSTPRSPARTALYATVFTVSAGLFAVYYFDARSALHRYVLNPLLRNTTDAESAHKFALKVLKSGLAPRDPLPDDKRLAVRLWDQEISNPVGLAAGFDKEGEAIDGLYNLGFSWVEIGSVTPNPQPGNPKPRVFRLTEDEALINRYGFPSQGHLSVLGRVRGRLPSFLPSTDTASLRPNSILAVNLGKNKTSPVESIDDYIKGVRAFGPYSDVLVVNVSSPNTPGLRGLQNKELLEKLLNGVIQARNELPVSAITAKRPKLLLKIAPDLDEAQLSDIANVVQKSGIDGVIVSNTTIERPKTLKSPNKGETGGLSGAILKPIALDTLRTLRGLLPSSIPIIGCGGIRSGADALEYAKAGACMVQVFTGFTYEGVGNCRRIKDELVQELAKQGTTWQAVVNEAVDGLSAKEKPTTVDSAVKQLMHEARELEGLLNQLEEKISQ